MMQDEKREEKSVYRKALSNPIQLRTINVLSQVGAGKVVPFTSKANLKIQVPLQEQTNIYAVEVCGDSLMDKNIHDGDFLIFRTEFQLSEITPEKVCIVYLHTTGELIARCVRFHPEGIVTLCAANPAYPNKSYFADEIEIRGLVFRVCFDL